MSIIRVQEHRNYTIMSNVHLRDKNLSLKAKGLMSQMLSLPPDWDYTVAGLVSINKESETAITGALKELKEYGYLVVQKHYPGDTASGRIEYEYVLYEEPHIEAVDSQGEEIQGSEIQDPENLPLEIVGQLNTDNKLLKTNRTEEINKENKENTGAPKTAPKKPKGEDKKGESTRKRYGESGWVMLTDEEYKRLLADFGQAELNRCIDYIDESAQITGNKNKWKDWNRVIRRCSREGWGKSFNKKQEPKYTYEYEDEDDIPF